MSVVEYSIKLGRLVAYILCMYLMMTSSTSFQQVNSSETETVVNGNQGSDRSDVTNGKQSSQNVSTLTSQTHHHVSHHRLFQPQQSTDHSSDDMSTVTAVATPNGRISQTKPLRKSAILGSSRILECDVRYPGGVYVQHIVTWRKLGLEAPIFILFDGYPPRLDSTYYGRVRPVGQASIELSNITEQDQGWYECSVLFLDRSDDVSVNGTWIHLSVNVPPALNDVSPSLLIHNEGDNVDLRCDATGTPTPNLTWFKDGRELTSSNHVTVVGRRVQLRALRHSDAGVYTCTFKNIIGSASHTIKLVVRGSIYITLPPRNTTVVEGSRVRLQCQAEGYPDNITYRWYRDGVDVQLVPDFMQVRGQVMNDGTLVIANVAKDDTAWYKCRASNLVGSSPEAQAYLNVTYVPRVLAVPERLYLPRGLLGRIECPVQSNPPLTVIVWSKSGRPIDFQSARHAKVNKQGTLIFLPVISADDGQYTCTPYSPMGAGHPSTPIRVFVRDPPYFTVRPKPFYQSELSKSVVLPCMADGDPKPVVSWRKADGPFPASSRVSVTSLGNMTLNRLSREDHGVYECVAASVVASVITTTLLIVELSTRHAAHNITVSTSRSAAKLTWMPAYDSGLPLHYVLWYRSQEGPKTDWRTWRVVPAACDVMSLTLYSLNKDTLYEFTVMSRSPSGVALFSEPFTAKTKAGPTPSDWQQHTSSSDSSQPSVPEFINTPPTNRRQPNIDAVTDDDRPPTPLNLSVIPHRNSLQITWSIAGGQTVRPADYYIVQYKTVGHWVPLSNRIPAGQLSYNWTTASRGAVYHFRVIGYYDPLTIGVNGEHQGALVDDTGSGSDDDSLESLPSVTFTVNTGDPLTENRAVSQSFLGGIGLITICMSGTLIVCILLVHCYRRWRNAKKAEQAGQMVPTCDTDQEIHYDNHIQVPISTHENGGGAMTNAVKETPI